MVNLFRIFIVLILVTNTAFAQYANPAGLVISQTTAENNRTWYFCPNGNVQLVEDVWPEKSIYQGKWHLNNKDLYVSLTLHYGKRGVGEPWVSESSAKGYNEYIDFVHIVKNEHTLNWLTMLDEKKEIAFKLIKENYTCATNFYSPQLPGQYPIASYRVLNVEDLKGLSAEELAKMRTEILARYGQKFNNSKLSDYYQNQEWYFPQKESVKQYLTNIEKRNIYIISTAERKAAR
jgi:hypothetical protein